MHKSHILCVCLVFAFASDSVKADWPEFRGPRGQGHAADSGVPLVWSAVEHVAWSQTIDGNGWSSPIVVGDAVYLTSAVTLDDGGRSLRALRLDAGTGQVKWTVETFRQDELTAPAIHDKNSHASPTPISDGEHIFVHFGHAGTACLTPAGEVVWRNQDLSYEPVHGNGGSPILVGDLLVFSCDGAQEPFIAALDKRRGNVRWKTIRKTDAQKNFSFSTPQLIHVNGRPQIISPGSNCVCALNPADGREIWRVNYDGYSVIPRPVFGNQMLYVCTGFGQPKLLAINPSGTGDVTETHVQWQINSGVPLTPSLILDRDRIFMVSDRGVVSCVDALNGALRWKNRLPGEFSASPILVGGYVYAQNETGTGYVFKAADQFQQVAKNELGEPTLASYAVSDSSLFIRTESKLYRISQ